MEIELDYNGTNVEILWKPNKINKKSADHTPHLKYATLRKL